MTKLYYPWSQTPNKKISKKSQEIIYDNLHRLGYPIFKFQKQKPDEKTLKAINYVCTEMEELSKSPETPWVLVLSNSMTLLQSIATLVPMAYALTYSYSVISINNPKIVGALSSNKPLSPFQDDPAGAMIDEVKHAGLLVWSGIEQPIFKGAGCSAEVVDILSSRVQKPTIFLNFYPEKFTKKVLASVWGAASTTYSSQVSDLLRSYVKPLNIYVRREIEEGLWRGIKL